MERLITKEKKYWRMNPLTPGKNSIDTLGRLIAVCGLIVMSFLACALDSDPRNLGDLVAIQQRVQAVLEVSQRATVGLDGGGSGVIISADGMILTAAHVSMDPGRIMTVSLLDGREVKAETLGMNRFADAGLAKIMEPGDWPYVEMAQKGERSAGNWCFALGHPSGFESERGAVLRVGRIIGQHALVMRTDCHLIGGDSGGPLFNLRGEVIGIHSRVSDEIDDNYHAPIEAFQRHWDLFLAGEVVEISRNPEGGFLGVRSELDVFGARIKEVVAGTPAAGSPLKAGDVIVSVEGVAVFDPNELGWALERHAPGTTVRLAILRGNRSQIIKVQLGRRPVN